MAFRLPVFNLTANIWHGILPPSLAGPTGLPPDIPPDLSPTAQLYLSKYGPGGWFHAWPDDIRISLERAGYITLRCPLDTDVRAPWMPTLALTWADLDLVEVPANSGRYYVAVMVEQAHAGFPNEYRIAILAQVALTAPSGFPGDGFWIPTGPITLAAGGGTGSSLLAVPGSLLDLAAGGGSGSDMVTAHRSVFDLAAGGGSGSALVAVPGSPLDLVAGGGSGSALVAVPGSPLDLVAGGGSGSALVAVPGSPLDLVAGGGSGSDATVTSGSGAVAPSATCGGAAAVTLTFTHTGSVSSPNSDWWYFNGIAGTVYHIDITAAAGVVSSADLATGACGSQTVQVNVSPGMGNRGHFTLASSQRVYIQVLGGISAGIYTVEVGTGV